MSMIDIDGVAYNEEPAQSLEVRSIPVWEWFCYMLGLSLPILNILTLLALAFLPNTHPSLRNFGRAALLLLGIRLLISLLTS